MNDDKLNLLLSAFRIQPEMQSIADKEAADLKTAESMDKSIVLRRNERDLLNKVRRAKAIAARDAGAHPEHEIALQNTLAGSAFKAALKVEMSEYLGRGIRFVDLYRGGMGTSEYNYRSMTIAYTVDQKDVITVATALLHPEDKYSKFMGRLIAGRNHAHGSHISLRKPGNKSVHQYLHDVFFEAVAP